MVEGVSFINIFVKTIDYFFKLAEQLKQTTFVETKKGGYLNFTPQSFRTAIEVVGVDKKQVEYYLKIYRDLGFLITKEGAYTNIQSINGKAMRVFTVSRSTYETLKKLGFGTDEEI